MKFGALNKTATVEIIVNNVNMIRHKRSTTIAANFQSFVISLKSSSFRSWYIERQVMAKDDIDIWSNSINRDDDDHDDVDEGKHYDGSWNGISREQSVNNESETKQTDY